MTDSEINDIWHKEIVGGCVHERLKSSICRSGLQQEITKAWECVSCGIYFVWNNGIARKKNKRIPDYANDPAVFRECVVEWLEIGDIEKVGNEYHLCNDKKRNRIGPKNWIFVKNTNPNHAVMLAVLKMEGVEV